MSTSAYIKTLQGVNGVTGPIGPTGPQGATGVTGPSGGGTVMYSGTGTINFSAPTGNAGDTDGYTVITGQAGITPANNIQVWMQGDSTADFNDAEHLYTPITLRAGSVASGVGFTITYHSDLRLNGNFVVRWMWF